MNSGILRNNITSNVWQRVKRINTEILKVKELNKQSLHIFPGVEKWVSQCKKLFRNAQCRQSNQTQLAVFFFFFKLIFLCVFVSFPLVSPQVYFAVGTLPNLNI